MDKARDLFDTPRARQLRKTIQAHRIKRLHWSDFVFRYIMEGLGFGRSLRELPESRLEELHQIIIGYRRERPQAFRYDAQGRYMYRLQKEAGWSDDLLRQYLIVNFKKTHWNILDPAERAKVISDLQNINKEI
ncbi:MAG: hypothetical protein WCR34_03290 [Bacilli bacterium]